MQGHAVIHGRVEESGATGHISGYSAQAIPHKPGSKDYGGFY